MLFAVYLIAKCMAFILNLCLGAVQHSNIRGLLVEIHFYSNHMIKYVCYSCFALVIKVLDNFTHILKTMCFKFVHLLDYLIAFRISRMAHRTKDFVRYVQWMSPVNFLLETWHYLSWVLCTVSRRSKRISKFAIICNYQTARQSQT